MWSHLDRRRLGIHKEIRRSVDSTSSVSEASKVQCEYLSPEDSKEITKLKHIITHSVTMARTKNGQEVYVFTDAFESRWGVIVT